MTTSELLQRAISNSKWMSSKLKKEISIFHPLLVVCLIIIIGWALMVNMASVKLILDAPNISPDDSVIAGEATARMKTGLTFLVLVSVSIGVSCLAVFSVWARTSKTRRNDFLVICLIFISFTCLGLLVVDFSFKFNTFGRTDNTFLDMFGKEYGTGKNIFELTIGKYPKFLGSHPNSFEGDLSIQLMWFNLVALFISLIGSSLLFSAVCTLIPYRTYVMIRRPRKYSQQQIESAARQISKQMRDLKYYLFAGAFLLLSAILYMSASREWPLPYFPSNQADDLNAFTDIVRSTILFQSGHFVLILLAAFLPVALRLRNAGERLSHIAFHSLKISQHNSWMAERGLSLTIGGSLQGVLAVISPFLVPAFDFLRNLLQS